MRRGRTGVVELPPYVRRVLKKGRCFYYYHRHRGTAVAWPAIALPEPFDERFLKRVTICDSLEWDGEVFRLGNTALPGHRSSDFWPIAENAKAASERKAHAERKTFASLIETFKNHDAYKALAKSTRRGYDHYAEIIEHTWGDDLPADLTTVDAQEAIDSMGDTPAAANQFRAYLSRLMAFGIPRGFNDFNPVAFTEKMQGSEPWPSWPDWAFKLFFDHAAPHIALPAVSALFTGQRQVDVLAMPRPKKGQTDIPVRAQKTGEIVWIPVHSEYRQWIQAIPKVDAVQLHLGVRGQPYTPDGYRTQWNKLMREEDEKTGKPIFERFRQERIVFHGLRKNAVVMLLEAGCTEAQVSAIVNMSEQMVRHYGRDARVKVLAREGMKLLENRWAELRPTALPRTGTERELETDE